MDEVLSKFQYALLLIFIELANDTYNRLRMSVVPCMAPGLVSLGNIILLTGDRFQEWVSSNAGEYRTDQAFGSSSVLDS